ncbi:sulfotransferase family protein [Nonomuraea sp. CA-141351]|uniref:sulfotransferase family protein n=1 Tax=Nonomuraea sp. CA-141351 TaxID=3239996 RepID=UPI003D903CAF
MKVIGVGFGRTGTTSLAEALEQLGFGPCYHMFNIVEEPHRIQPWLAAAQGRPVDWEEVFSGFESVLDFPAAAFWRQIIAAFPDTKVILTVRDPRLWYESAASTIFKKAIESRTRPLPARIAFRLLTRLSPDFGAFTQMVDLAVVQGLFDGRIADPAHAIQVFERHLMEVVDEVHPERLMVYDVTEGWSPLCKFLDVPEPTRWPFPRGNDAESFHRDEGRRMKQLIRGSLFRRARAGG